jgi:hypothetical protein
MRPTCSNPVCRKLGHTIEMCWKKGGGAKGKGPKGWRYNKTNAPGTSAASITVTPALPTIPPTMASNVYPSPTELYANLADTKPGMFNTTPITMRSPDTVPNRYGTSVLDVECHSGENISVHGDIPVTCVLVASPVKCAVCNSDVSSYQHQPRIYLDSAASEHCWVKKSEIAQYQNIAGQPGSSVVAGEKFQIPGIGNVTVLSKVNGTEKMVELVGVRHTPEFSNNLISLTTLDLQGFSREWGGGKLSVRAPSGKTVMVGAQEGKMYQVNTETYANSA